MGGEGFDKSFQRELATQSWALYGVGMFIIFLRTYARFRRVRSAALLAPDDWIMITAVPAFYTTLIVCMNVIVTGGGSNLYPPEQYATFTEEDIQERIKGSKIVVVSEQAMLNLIWCIKACMLFMYARMTAGTSHRKWITYLSVYVALGWVAVEIAFFTACTPFEGYWGMPPPNPQCTTLEHYAMINAVFNLSSDVCMLLIPLPMLISLSLPLKQKLVLAIVFSMGIFVIVAAILTKVYNLSDVYDTSYMLWYIREASVAVLVSNLPGIWPLLRENFRFLRNHTSYPTGTSGLPQYGNHSTMQRSKHKSGIGLKEDEIELSGGSFGKSATRSEAGGFNGSGSDDERIGHFGRLGNHMGSGTRKGSPESDERVLNDPNSAGGSWGKGMNLEVHVDRTIEVQRASWDGSIREASTQPGKERFKWEVATQAPKVRIEGPEGEITNK